MSVSFEVPLSPTPQTIFISLNRITYKMTFKWCPPAAAWMLDIADANGVAIVSGISLVTGADLLEQYAYLGIGGKLICQTDHAPLAPPTFDNLGVEGHLYFVPT